MEVNEKVERSSFIAKLGCYFGVRFGGCLMWQEGEEKRVLSTDWNKGKGMVGWGDKRGGPMQKLTKWGCFWGETVGNSGGGHREFG